MQTRAMEPHQELQARREGAVSWRYRVFRSDHENEVSYSIHEVYTMDDGISWTTDEMSPRGETLRGLADDLERMGRALYEPVLREVLNVQGEPYLVETDDERLCLNCGGSPKTHGCDL